MSNIVAALSKDQNYYRLKDEIEEFLYNEAELLDQRRYNEWLDLLAEDLVYYMPMRRNVRFGRHAEFENTRQGQDINWFDESRWTLSKRVEQIMTGVHWAEEPLSRVSHLVSNVKIVECLPDAAGATSVTVNSKFLIYQNRNEYESNMFIGRRTDILRGGQNGWKVARREILLDQNVLLAKNLTVFF
jgi:3-phenylpropionate/cinnamic acid dioxygenase small subunit